MAMILMRWRNTLSDGYPAGRTASTEITAGGPAVDRERVCLEHVIGRAALLARFDDVPLVGNNA